MFCGKCGTNNADNAAFCRACGASLVQNEIKPLPAQYGSAPQNSGTEYVYKPYNPVAVQNAKKRTKIIGFLASVLGVVAAVVLVLAIFLGGASPEELAEEYIEAAVSGDADAALELLPEEVFKKMAVAMGGSENEIYSEIKQEFIEGAMQFRGATFDVKYSTELYGENLQKLLATYIGIGYDATAITEITVTIYSGGQAYDESVFAVEIDGDWYIAMESLELFL